MQDADHRPPTFIVETRECQKLDSSQLVLFSVLSVSLSLSNSVSLSFSTQFTTCPTIQGFGAPKTKIEFSSQVYTASYA